MCRVNSTDSSAELGTMLAQRPARTWAISALSEFCFHPRRQLDADAAKNTVDDASALHIARKEA